MTEAIDKLKSLIEESKSFEGDYLRWESYRDGIKASISKLEELNRFIPNVPTEDRTVLNDGVKPTDSEMTFEEKSSEFLSKNARQLHLYKTDLNKMPIKFGYGSTTSDPDIWKEKRKTIKVNLGWSGDSKMWIKWCDNPWKIPFGGYDKKQILEMINICKNDVQVESLISLLYAEA